MHPFKLFSQAWTSARRLGAASLDLLAPGFCRSCGGPVPVGEDPFCAACLGRIRWIDSACARCALPVMHPAPAPVGKSGADALPPRCGACSSARLLFDWAAAAALYSGPMRDAILAYKFRSDRGVLPLLREALGRAAKAPWMVAALAEAGGIVPIPLHPLKRWWRGRDVGRTLAAELSAQLAATTTLPVLDLLRKRRWTPPQSSLGGARRRRSQRNAFVVKPDMAAPRVVVLVDDVLTTGATASECARALKRRGARRVIVVALARSE